jgi:hypothetical protein
MINADGQRLRRRQTGRSNDSNDHAAERDRNSGRLLVDSVESCYQQLGGR